VKAFRDLFEKLHIPIVVKLVGITVTLLLVATVWIALQSSTEFEKISVPREKDANGEAAEDKAAQVNVLFDKYREKLGIAASLLMKAYKTPEERDESLQLSFYKDPDFVNVEVISLDNGKQEVVHRISKPEYLKEFGLTAEYLASLRKVRPFPVASVFSGNIEVRNSSIAKGAPLVTIGMPIMVDDSQRITHIALADLRLDGLQKPFSRVAVRSFYLVDKEAGVLAHPDDKLVLEGKSLGGLEVVKKALSSTISKGEMRYFDNKKNDWTIASYAQTQYGPAVVAEASEATILEPAMVVRRKAFFITGLVLSGAIFFVFLFSISLTSPIERLVEVTRRVAAGDFNVVADVHTGDEVGELGASFDAMVAGLRERDKMKNVLNKFHGSSVTDDLLKGDLQLGGVNKNVTVFFSDIRDFTKFSEGHTPEEVVGMLNEYFEIMVGIVTRNHGVVDKFVGDAMMAVWGAPKSTGEDEIHAARACLQMREALATLNELRMSRGQVEIKIGMGLNCGPAISGTIGSSERMEYTVIGDTVNTASRVESSTKAFGTDLLISGEVLEKIKEKFVSDYAGAAEVKGKAEPLKMYKVKGYINEAGETVMVQTKYSDYEAGHDAKVKVA
jgi:adenylate cyclase